MKTVEGSHFDFRRLFTGAIRFGAGAGAAAIISTSPSGFGGAAPPRAVDLVVRIFIPLVDWRVGWNSAGVCRRPGGLIACAGESSNVRSSLPSAAGGRMEKLRGSRNGLSAVLQRGSLDKMKTRKTLM